jgi:hypothetical protein
MAWLGGTHIDQALVFIFHKRVARTPNEREKSTLDITSTLRKIHHNHPIPPVVSERASSTTTRNHTTLQREGKKGMKIE